MKVFGTGLFSHKKQKALYDFAQHGVIKLASNYGSDYIQISESVGRLTDRVKGKKEEPKKKETTPKEIFLAKSLNLPDFEINTNEEYINEQIDLLERKLELYPKPETEKQRRNRILRGSPEAVAWNDSPGAVKYGYYETEGMIIRMENRKKLAEHDGYSRWPYTTNDAIRRVMSENTNLEAEQVMPSLPDLPEEAVKVIETYRKYTSDLCGMEPIFYLIKPKKDRAEVERKRDPILIAQSPFGYFWQILGAWDEEVKFLEEL